MKNNADAVISKLTYELVICFHAGQIAPDGRRKIAGANFSWLLCSKSYSEMEINIKISDSGAFLFIQNLLI